MPFTGEVEIAIVNIALMAGSLLLMFLVFCVLLFCVLTFLTPCCDVRYDFRITTMFGSSLSPVVCRRVGFMSNLHYLCVLRHSSVQHILCFCFVCHRPVSCVPSVASFSGWYIRYCLFGFL